MVMSAPAQSNQESIVFVARIALFVALLASIVGFQSAAAQQTGPVASAATSYMLGSGDKLRITVFNEPNLTGEFNVSDTGTIAFPLIGRVDVNGKSAQEAQEMIRVMLADGYLNAPQVSLEVTKYRPYYIYGEIVRSGEYPFASGLTAQQAIASAGGYSYRASRRYVYLRRGNQAAEARLDFKSNPLIFVMPGDTLRIGERHF
jgi:polysaccharide export outer membrane protein